jgi:hypothetical protein
VSKPQNQKVQMLPFVTFLSKSIVRSEICTYSDFVEFMAKLNIPMSLGR